MALMTLGDLELDGFEVPASVRFGGSQAAVVHKLLGGGRIIDTMGRDDSALTWRGILSGTDAGDRARALDAMRAAGAVLPLAWDAYCYNVIVAEIEFEFCNPWWIRYHIECTVLSDLAQFNPTFALDVTGSVLGDISAAAAYVTVDGILNTLAAPSAISPGSSSITPALIGLTATQASISSGITIAEQQLDSSDLTTLVSSCGSLAQLSTAQGYVGRSVVNLESVLV